MRKLLLAVLVASLPAGAFGQGYKNITPRTLTLGSTPITLGGTTTIVTGLTLSSPTLTGTAVLPGSGAISPVGELSLLGSPLSQLTVGGTYTTANSSKFLVLGSLASSVTGNQNAAVVAPTFAPSGASVGGIFSLNLNPGLNSTAFTIPAVYGVYNDFSYGASFTGVIGAHHTFFAADVTPGGGSITNLNQFNSAAITNGNGITSGTVTNNIFSAPAITAAAGAGGTLVNTAAKLFVPSGSSAGNTDRALWITGNGGALSTKYALYSDSTAASLFSGELGLAAGKALAFKTGTGARAGDATLVAGTITVTNTTVTANTRVYLTRKTAGGTIGDLSYTLSAGASFTINSVNVLDTSTVSYLLVEVN